MSRLPIVGSDEDNWGEVLNDFLLVSMQNDGTLNNNVVIKKDKATIAQLRTAEGEAGNIRYLTGYYTAGDRRGGHFYWDAASTETDNGGTIIKVAGVATGRWKRLYSGAIKVEEFGVIADSGVTDNLTAFRAAVALGLPLTIEEVPGEYFGTTEAIYQTTDTVIDIVGIGMPEIKVTSAMDAGDSDKNSLIKLGASVTKVYARNLLLTGNWDGVTDPATKANGIGFWSTPANDDDVIIDIDNVHGREFLNYGVYVFANKFKGGLVIGSANGWQGVAVVNVRDWMNIEEAVGFDNGLIGVDCEWTSGRNMGMQNLRFGVINVYGNGEHGFALTTATNDEAVIAGEGLFPENFTCEVGAIYSEGNSQNGALSGEGCIIDFPYFNAQLVDCKDNRIREFIIRNSYDGPSSRKINIDTIVTKNGTAGCYIQGSATVPAKEIRIGTIHSSGHSGIGIFFDSADFVEHLVVTEMFDISNGTPVSIVNPYFSGRRFYGSLGGSDSDAGITKTTKWLDIDLDETGVVTRTIYVPSDATLLSCIIDIITADTDVSPPRYRIEWDNGTGDVSVADIRADIVGTRRIYSGLQGKFLDVSDVDSAAVPFSRTGRFIQANPVSTWNGDGLARMYVEWF